jgi:uncharacterized protein (TIGR02646 family)
MRYITKQGTGGYQLENANANPPVTAEQATTRWKSFNGKDAVTGYLLSAQYHLCAYSEVRPDLLNLGTHIEHVEPKSANPARTFDCSNLVLSALTSESLSKLNRADVFGGHAKLSVYDATLFISCLQPDCSKYFVYLSNGTVEPSKKLEQIDQVRAQYTIDLLNLNSPYLVNLRLNWLDELDKFIDQHIQDDWSLEHLAAIDLVPWAGKLSRFFTATRQRFGKVAEQILANQAPELL